MSIPAAKQLECIYFGVEPPEDRISLIKHISKEHILTEITGLNYRLKPKDKVYIDNSLNTQRRELEYFTFTSEVYKKYSTVAERHKKTK